MRRRITTALLLAAGVILLPAPADGQGRPPPNQESSRGWAPIQIGARFGYVQRAGGNVVGAQVRIPVLRSGAAELVPGGALTFNSGGRKDRDYTLDGVYVLGGPEGGLYGGGGWALRSAIWELEGDRETKSGPTAVLGLKTSSVGGAPVGVQIQVRWVWVEENITRQIMTFGVNFPLWGHGGR
jgi:hypothetical protein